MELLFIWALVFILYVRTVNYNYVIDDQVRREGYMYEVPMEAPPNDFWEKKPSLWYRLFMIGMHCVNVSIIYLLWGWGPALLFAVHPIGVWCTAWVTGNYYATAAYFTLIAFYILQSFPGNPIGIVVAMLLYTSALNSTVCPINFPFLFLFTGTPWGLTMLFPLVMFLRGRKFQTGIKIRLSFNKDKPNTPGINRKFGWERGVIMVKVMARYLFHAFYPDKLSLFGPFGEDLRDDPKVWKKMVSFNSEFWLSLSLLLSVFVTGLAIHPMGTLWFFVFISLHSQWNLTGQFYAQRYLYLPLVGMCVVAGTFLQQYPILMTIAVTWLTIRSHLFIPIWKSQDMIWKNDVITYSDHAKAYSNLAQHYMSKPITHAYTINEVATLMSKAMYLNPNAWEIQMNQACFMLMYAKNVEGALFHTEKAIELLEPLGGLKHPLNKLYEQRENFKKEIARQKAELEKQKGHARSAILSRPVSDNQGGRNEQSKISNSDSAGEEGRADDEGFNSSRERVSVGSES